MPAATLLRRVAPAILLALAAANCAGPQALNSRVNKYGVAPSPKVIADGEPVPKGGGRDMVGKPYVVGGRTYVPTNGRGYVREGWASWYGTAFHGRLTANGEIFDRDSVAAASPTLPLPSYVRVTNVVNKRSMVVRVNDRGPYEQNRLIDLSERAAVALDFHRRGTSRVKVEYLGKASLKGSDDQKLLATLRLDGAPASFGGARGPVMLADLRDEPAPRPRPVVERTVVAEAPVPSLATAVEETAMIEPPRPVRVAAAETVPVEDAEADDPAVPVPPRRPAELGGSGLTAPLKLQPGPIATVELLPPQRPTLTGIY